MINGAILFVNGFVRMMPGGHRYAQLERQISMNLI